MFEQLVPAKLFSFALQKDENGIEATWEVPSDLPYFEGHFPGRPILPAVAIVDATVETLHRLGQPGELASIVSAKFTAAIEPGRAVRIRLTEVTENEWSALWLDRDRGERLAELRVRLR